MTKPLDDSASALEVQALVDEVFDICDEIRHIQSLTESTFGDYREKRNELKALQRRLIDLYVAAGIPDYQHEDAAPHRPTPYQQCDLFTPGPPNVGTLAEAPHYLAKLGISEKKFHELTKGRYEQKMLTEQVYAEIQNDANEVALIWTDNKRKINRNGIAKELFENKPYIAPRDGSRLSESSILTHVNKG